MKLIGVRFFLVKNPPEGCNIIKVYSTKKEIKKFRKELKKATKKEIVLRQAGEGFLKRILPFLAKEFK